MIDHGGTRTSTAICRSASDGRKACHCRIIPREDELSLPNQRQPLKSKSPCGATSLFDWQVVRFYLLALSLFTHKVWSSRHLRFVARRRAVATAAADQISDLSSNQDAKDGPWILRRTSNTPRPSRGATAPEMMSPKTIKKFPNRRWSRQPVRI